MLTDYSYPDCSVSTNDVELTCPCPELLYYNFEEYVTFAEAQRFENVADANWLFWFGLVTSNPGGVVAGKIGNAMFNSTGEARVIRTPTTTGDFSNCLDFTGRSWTIRFWFKPVGPQAFGGQDILNIGDGGSSPQISVSWGGTLNARYPGSYVFVANLRNPDAVQTPDGGPIDPTSGLDWTRCVMTYDVATETFWMKTDNNAFLEYPYPGFALGTQGCGLAINAGSNSFYIDELAVIPDVVWSEADATYDWNGGAGRTYPDLP